MIKENDFQFQVCLQNVYSKLLSLKKISLPRETAEPSLQKASFL